MSETGPIYNVPLIDTLPLDGGMFQQMPSRSDLEACSKRFMRVAAGYEVLLAHYQRAMTARVAMKAEMFEEIERLRDEFRRCENIPVDPKHVCGLQVSRMHFGDWADTLDQIMVGRAEPE